jgi:transcription-repair coupling factor (superfamily II helicase)
MLISILKLFAQNASLASLRESLTRSRRAMVHGLGGSSAAFLAACLSGENAVSPDCSLLALLPTEEEAEAFREDIESILGASAVKYFPERDVGPYEQADSHVEVRSQRVEALDSLERGWKGVVVATAGALHDPTTPPGMIELISLDVKKGMQIAFPDLVKSLVAKGFKRQNMVTAAGQVAVRGGIVDVFPFGGEIPYRIEFWGDEIESIRTFSTSSQRSLSPVEQFRIIPPDEFVTEAGINASDEHRMKIIEAEAGIDLAPIRNAIRGEERPNGMEQYLHVVFGARASLVSYFSESDCVLVFDPQRCMHEVDRRLEHASIMWERQHEDDPDLPPPKYFYSSSRELMDSLGTMLVVENHELRPTGARVIEFSISPCRQYQGSMEELKKDIQSSHRNSLSCHIACDNKGQVDRLNELLEEVEGYYSIGIAHLSGGFTDSSSGLFILTDHEIFSRYRRRVRYRKFKEGVPIPDYRALNLGDFVVHVDYGIGKYMGLKRIKAGDVEKDCLFIQYKGTDQLFVPVEQLKRIKKYTSEEGVLPVITKLGGTSWENLKARTKKSIQRMAEDLLKLYAERKALPGHAFKPDKQMLKALEDSFVYEETPDQLRAWAEVLADMESPSPMDRLICGDVGFGKTEVAIRAAYCAVLDNRQVAILVPTTILADQHDETFRERFADFPVRVETISRFRSKAEQKTILQKLAEGKVDIIIGTHRLLSKDVHFKNLGLLVVDEEQRFGVRHKERIKKMRRNVDVLSMSATPIPRTLNMSLLGARDISFINTPPRDRYSVHTEIIPFEEKYVVEAVMREIDRGGQVFFVHNRVASINSMAAYLRTLMPSVTLGVGHGQLRENELEKIMRDFHHGKFQTLISTMIIENGLDIPSVNTIIINRADTFGLSQLYQLRGRVGRSNRRAYAYLLVPPKAPLTKIARQRLKIIEEFADLGSGFKIAMRDLEIRGAGNILGTEQTGFIAAVGFDLYNELLKETIAEMKGEKVERPPDVEINIKIDTYIPEEYIADAGERVLFYRRLAETVSLNEVKAIEDEMIDRFGRPPQQVVNLLVSTYIRHFAAQIGITEVSARDGEVVLIIPETIEVTRASVEKIVRKSPVRLNFSFQNGMRINFTPPEDKEGFMGGIKKVLQALIS